MRKKIVAGNWKMNCDLPQTEDLLQQIKANYSDDLNHVKLIVSPTYPNLYQAFQMLKETDISIAAQNIHQEEKGAFTGEVSAAMLKSIGVEYVIIGHSERRQYFNETNTLLAKKVNTAIAHDFQIMFCVGEQLEDRESENHFNIVKSQITESLFQLKSEDWSKIIIAYEPVWAIGTGKTASADQAQEMHAFIRQIITEQCGSAIAQNISILYGGSVKPNNAAEIFSKEDVDGGLIGGASLKADDFLKIASAF